jgi:subtilisin family serine protease
MPRFTGSAPLRAASLAALLALLTACGGGSGSPAPESASATAAPTVSGFTDQIIVKPSNSAVLAAYESRAAEFAQALSGDAGMRLTAVRQTHAGGHVLSLPTTLPAAQVAGIASRLRQRADVEYAEPDILLQPTAIPNDTQFNQLWHLREPAVAAGGINAVDAWDLTTGDPNLVVAVVDTGVLRHRDFNGRVIAGYDFISNAAIGNDGNGRDADAVDSGDWLTAGEAAALDRTPRASSWHGTHVAGTIAASGNNGQGVAGVNWQSKILPVRVLGKGGGYLSDISDGIAWAAGLTVSGVPANTTPARVINLSLGGAGSCSQTTQSAINAAVGRGAVVVVAAGNEDINAFGSQPANCAGVISVAAVGSAGQRASYSNFGSTVTIAAPGGDPQRDSGVLSLGDAGERAALNDGTLLASYGTSMAAPHVAGVVSLILSVNPALSPAEVKALLQSTARAFPTGTGRDCTTALCGAGIVNAGSAVRAAANVPAGVAAAIPQSGVWWNPAENGRGYVIEIRDGKLNFGAYLYDATGRATWVSSGPAAMQSATRYTGTLDAYAAGQTLTGPYKPAVPRGTLGNVTLDFTGQTTATLTWPGGTVRLERFRFGSTAPATTFAPEAGVWWNPQESGRGWSMEVQNGVLALTGFMYDAAGDPTWHLAVGPMSSATTFSGNFIQYANGQTLTGAYKPASVVNANAGSVSVRFIDTANAVLTLPDGRNITLEKFRIGGAAPGITMPLNQVLTARLVGVWSLTYRIVSEWTDTFLFNEVRESTNYPGEYNVWGINQYDSLAVGGWDPELGQYTIYAPGFEYDDFYVVDLPTVDSMTGCYYLVFRNPTQLSECYRLTGSKIQEIAPLDIVSLQPYRSTLPAATRATALARESAQAGSRAAPLSKAPVLARKPEVDALIRAVEARRAAR